jgi:hypothetical protein
MIGLFCYALLQSAGPQVKSFPVAEVLDRLDKVHRGMKKPRVNEILGLAEWSYPKYPEQFESHIVVCGVHGR